MRSSLKKFVKKYKLLSLTCRAVLNFYFFINHRLIYPLINKRRLIHKLKHVDKLNVGCGDEMIEGWLNIGLFPDGEIPYGTIKIINGALVLHFDVTEELPIDAGVVRYVYASHFIEHLGFAEGIAVIERCYKAMKKGGVIRLTTPDLELWIKNYYEDNFDFFRKYKNICFNAKDQSLVETKGEIFMLQLYDWGHKWNYDFESMKHILEKIGFSQVTKKKAFESLIPDIKKIEPGGEGRLLESLYVEAVKK